MSRLVYSTDPDSEPPRRRSMRDAPPDKQLIYVERSRKGRGGKTVTIMSGFQHDPKTLKALLKKLKSACGAGGTLREPDTLEIQGDHRDNVIERLEKMGYKTRQKGG